MAKITKVPVATKEANDLKVDDLRVKSGLEKVYEKIE